MCAKALDGVLVIDLTHAYNGPFCTMQLADHGAEVIKIEPLDTGDQTRGWAPFKQGVSDSSYYAFLNRNKKGMTLNMKSEEGKKIFIELVKKADVVVENFRPGSMERLGLSYEELKKINPRIIYASSSGFGQYGPYRDRPAYDVIAQAMGGIMNVTGEVGGPPVKVGPGLGDNFTGTFLASGIAMALYHREKTGVGNRIDVAMVDVIFSALETVLPFYDTYAEISTRAGNIDPATSPYDMYPCKDGYLVTGVASPKLWVEFCRAIGRPDLEKDSRFADNDLRVKNRGQLTAEIHKWTTQNTVAEAEATLLEKGVPCGPIFNIEQCVNNAHFKEREMVVEVDHPTIGKMRIQGVTVKFTETPGSVDAPAPLLGQHTDTILKGMLNFSDEKIHQLRVKRII